MSDPDRRTNEGEEEPQGPVIRDKRRIDPDTYQVREPQGTAAPAAPAQPAGPDGAPGPADSAEAAGEAGAATAKESPQNGEVANLKASLAERTADLQRLQAEYINYKRRVERDRELVRAVAVENVFRDLLGVLDDIRSAREHEELTGGFKAVAEELARVAGKYGVESYGSKGDAFDPHVHEALMHVPAQPDSPASEGPSCVEILQPGYKIGDRVLRPARVAVADPPESSGTAAAQPVAAEGVADGRPGPDDQQESDDQQGPDDQPPGA